MYILNKAMQTMGKVMYSLVIEINSITCVSGNNVSSAYSARDVRGKQTGLLFCEKGHYLTTAFHNLII